MITSEADLLLFLQRHHIPYQRIEHPPVFTCEQAELYRPPAPGVSTKNLFVRDRRGRFFLVMTACEKQVDLKALGQRLGASKLHFASPADLMARLGVSPGSVTVLALVNDDEHRVTLVVDSQIWPAEAYLCHPLVNTATLVLDHPSLEKFFALTGHAIHLDQGD